MSNIIQFPPRLRVILTQESKHLDEDTIKYLKAMLNETIMIYMKTGEGKELYDKLWNIFYDEQNNRRVL